MYRDNSVALRLTLQHEDMTWRSDESVGQQLQLEASGTSAFAGVVTSISAVRLSYVAKTRGRTRDVLVFCPSA